MTPWADTFEKVAMSWRPAAVTSVDRIAARPAGAFAAMLDQPSPPAQQGDPLPPLWHWFYHLPVHPRGALGGDGHPRTGDGLLPPLPDDRRRMFGGGHLTVQEPLRFGDEVVRTSELTHCRTRHGTNGPLLVTTLRHVFAVDDVARVVEEQDIIYLPPRTLEDAAAPDEPATAVPTAAPHGARELRVMPDPVLLFRFSSLTANAHRIHYDVDFARDVEGHADLVVQGPLSALLLLELPRLHAPGQTLTQCAWRARRPAYVSQELRALSQTDGDTIALRLDASTTEGAVVGTATLTPCTTGPSS